MDARVKELESRLATAIGENVARDAKINNLMAEKVALEKSLKDAENKLNEYKQSTQKIKDIEKELELANLKIQQSHERLNQLLKEKSELERQVAMLASEQKSAAETRLKDTKRIKELEKENEELQKKLNAATKDLNNLKVKSQSAKLADLEAQINILRSRLSIYETKAVPFTEEELALLKKAELSSTKPESYQPRRVRELPPEASRLVLEAQSSIESGELKQAETKLRQALKYDSTHLSVLFRLASVQIEQNNLEEAQKTINKALEIDPEDAGSLFLLGVLYDRLGRIDDAIDALSRSVKSNADNSDTQIMLGTVLSKKGLRNQAETAFRKAIQIQPGNAKAHMNLAVIYATQNPPFLELAKWHYQKALANGAEKNPELEKRLNLNASSGQKQDQQ